MQSILGPLTVASFLLSVSVGSSQSPAQPAGDQAEQKISLTVPAGAPLRLYLTKRIPKKAGTPVEANLLEPVFAFDHQVAPANAKVLGRVSRVEPVSKSRRFSAIFGGDFTPLHIAEIEFTTLLLPDGRSIPLHTLANPGLDSIVPVNAKPKKAKSPGKAPGNTGGVLGTGKQQAKNQINGQINARTRGIADIVRGPDKKDRLYDFAMSKLPYHPQYVRKGTRIDAELGAALDFGPESVQPGSLALLGSEPPADSVAHARLITPLDSSSSQHGQEVLAILTEPLFSSDHQLLLPQGTRVTGSVVVARRARWFHRGGQLRFNFKTLDLPPEVESLEANAPAPPVAGAVRSAHKLEFRTQATLSAAESQGKTPIKVDQEGGVQAQESKTRFIAPAISILIARSAADNDAGRNHSINGQSGNVSGRTLGGASGFGLLGMAAAQSSRYVGTALGFYGMGWSVYSNIIARGAEVRFEKNATIDIRFNTRKPETAAKFHAD